jgi:hypothetical protein
MNNAEMIELSSEVPAEVRQLPQDLKRILKVQWKELIHCIEDYELSRSVKQPLIFSEAPRRNAA